MDATKGFLAANENPLTTISSDLRSFEIQPLLLPSSTANIVQLLLYYFPPLLSHTSSSESAGEPRIHVFTHLLIQTTAWRYFDQRPSRTCVRHCITLEPVPGSLCEVGDTSASQALMPASDS